MKWLAIIPAVALSVVLLPILVDIAIKGLLLLAIVALVVLAMRRASAATSHFVWLSALAGLLVLPPLSLVTPSWRVLPSWLGTSNIVQLDIENLAGPAPHPASEFPAAQEPEQVASLAEPRSSHPRSLKPQTTHPAKKQAAQKSDLPNDLVQPGQGRPFHATWLEEATKLENDGTAHAESRSSIVSGAPILVAVWLSGVVLLGCRILLSGFGLWHLARTAERLTSQRPVELLQELSSLLGVCRQVQLVTGTRRDMPSVWGIVQPKILLPADWESWDDARMRTVLLHELAHIRRRDALAQLLVQAACALHWFNPLVWLAVFRVRVEREQACDDLVLNNGVKASDYANHLLSIAIGYDHSSHANAFAFAMARRFKLEGRIMRVLKRNLNRNAISRRTLVASIAAIVLLAIPLAMIQAVAPPAALGNAAATEKRKESSEAAAVKPDPQIAKWISQLGSKKLSVRRRAARELTKAGRKPIRALVRAITSKDAEVRVRALKILLALSISKDEATANDVLRAAERLLQSSDRRLVAKAKEIFDYSENYAKDMIRKYGTRGFQVVERGGKVRKLWGNLAESGLVYLKRLRHLEELALGETEITDAGLEQIKGMTHLKALFVGTSKISNAALKHLKGLKNLEHLGLNPSWRANVVNTQITDSGLEHLKGLTKLRSLYLSKANVTDLGPLKELTNLENLYLGSTTVTDAGLENLQGLKRLYQLNLSNTSVTGAGLRHLKGLDHLRILKLSGTKNVTNLALMGLTRLEHLDLSRSTVSDAGLKNLNELTNLRNLNLSGTKNVIHLAPMKGLTKLADLNLSRSTVTDAALANMKGLSSLRTLNLTSTSLTDAGLQHLKGLPNLQKLTLAGTLVTGTGLKHLKGLRSLSLTGSAVSDAGLEQLRAMTNLKSLNLTSKNVTDAGLEHLKGLTNLKRLILRRTGVTDAGLKHLQGLTRLSHLDLGSTKVTGTGLKHLKRLTKLDTLTLQRTSVSDDGVEYLKGLTNLRCLYLQKTNVSDRVTAHLLLLKNLEYLSLEGSKVTADGYRVLKQALPECSISR